VELVASIVDDVNRERSRYEQVKRFAVLDRDFEMERGEVTPTLKLRRRVVLDNFAAEVEGLYDGTTGSGSR
jgi:long-chain acyl-CoA synthetase